MSALGQKRTFRSDGSLLYLSSIRDRPSGVQSGGPMKRREFMFLLGGTIVFWPNPLWAQQSGRIFKIGHFESSTPSNSPTSSERSGIAFVN